MHLISRYCSDTDGYDVVVTSNSIKRRESTSNIQAASTECFKGDVNLFCGIYLNGPNRGFSNWFTYIDREIEGLLIGYVHLPTGMHFIWVVEDMCKGAILLLKFIKFT
jgi:hypothetical protein